MTTNWMLRSLRRTFETRSDPIDPDKMQSREYIILERFETSDETVIETAGTQRGGSIQFYTGNTQREAAAPTSGVWVCTSWSESDSDRGRNWREISEVWESWGEWEEFTPLTPGLPVSSEEE